jgi:hypothetical protein
MFDNVLITYLPIADRSSGPRQLRTFRNRRIPDIQAQPRRGRSDLNLPFESMLNAERRHPRTLERIAGCSLQELGDPFKGGLEPSQRI